MNKTERLYALVEELRAISPRPRSARWLAARFEVSARTIERDIAALQQSGVAIYPQPGRSGGYVLDRDVTLPPLAMTPEEALALAIALYTLADTPFEAPARSAVAKVLAVMPDGQRRATDQLARRIRFVTPLRTPADVPPAIRSAFSRRRVLRIDYTDRDGAVTARDVEPLGLLGGDQWYLLGWCRLRAGLRGFRLDRIATAVELDEPAPVRDIDLSDFPALGAELLDVTAITDMPLSPMA